MRSFKPSSLLLMLLPLALAACDSSQPSYSASNAPASQPPPPPAAAAQPAAAPAAPVQPASAVAQAAPANGTLASAQVPTAQSVHLPPAEQVGIGSCDAYVGRYRACLENDDSGLVASLQRKYQLAHALARQVREWKVQLKGNAKSGDIANACTQAGNEAKETLGKLGCRSI